MNCEGNKRPYVSDVLGDASMTKTSKRPKATSPPPVQIEKSQKKELLFFKGLEVSFLAQGFLLMLKSKFK